MQYPDILAGVPCVGIEIPAVEPLLLMTAEPGRPVWSEARGLTWGRPAWKFSWHADEFCIAQCGARSGSVMDVTTGILYKGGVCTPFEWKIAAPPEARALAKTRTQGTRCNTSSTAPTDFFYFNFFKSLFEKWIWWKVFSKSDPYAATYEGIALI
jgi:hypothetical protein